MANTATTFRFDDREREILESIKEEHNFPTLQKTVEHIIRSYNPLYAQIAELKRKLGRSENDNDVMRERLKAIRGAFNIAQYQIPGEENQE